VTQPNAPLFTPPQATALLDQILYEQVLECVDLDALYHLEQSLVLMVAELQDLPHDRATETTQTLLDRCLLRLPDELRGYLRAGPVRFDGCTLCDDLERDDDLEHDDRPRPKPRPAPRPKC
jgi:hypothetical protein